MSEETKKENDNFSQILPMLKQINSITNSVILKYPETIAISDSKDILIRINFEGLGISEFPDIPLMNSLSNFRGLLELFGDDRNVEFKDSEIFISEGTLRSSFITDNIKLMDDFNQNPQQFTRTREIKDVASFSLSVNDIAKIKKGASVFKDLSDIIISCKDGDVSLSLGATTKFNAHSNTFSRIYEESGCKDFSIVFPVSNFLSIPESNYKFMVKYNSVRDAYRIMLNCESLDGNLEIIMTIKV